MEKNKLKDNLLFHWSEPQKRGLCLDRMVIVELQSVLETALLFLSAFQLLSAVSIEHGKNDLEYCFWPFIFGIFAKLKKFHKTVRLCALNAKIKNSKQITMLSDLSQVP